MNKPGFPFVDKLSLNARNFWPYQIAGWVGFCITLSIKETLQILDGLDKFSDLPMKILSLIIYSILGIILTSLLRYFYRFVFKKQYSIFAMLGIIILVSFLIAMVHQFFQGIMGIIVYHYEPYSFLVLVINSIWNYPAFLGWSIMYFGIKYWNQSIADKEHLAKANSLAQSAQLQMLRYQLNPHFLFNSLNSIWALIDEDRKASKEMVSELAEFLRYSLMSKNYSDVPLQQEIEAIRHYLSIEKKRFEEKLEVEFNVDDGAKEYPVLSFLLNPLVENAVKYGMRTSVMPLKIAIIAKVTDRRLVLKVTNTGKWVIPDENEDGSGTGTGLKNIRLRLQNAFPDRSAFQIGQLGDKVIATIEIYGKS